MLDRVLRHGENSYSVGHGTETREEQLQGMVCKGVGARQRGGGGGPKDIE